MSDVMFLALGGGTLLVLALYAAPSTGVEGASMLEPLFGLLVAIALAIYLLITLLRPERF